MAKIGKLVADIRQDYFQRNLDIDSTLPDPITQFEKWFSEVLLAEQPEPNSMTLATATPDGKPNIRTVLLKGFDDRGFIFFTNYNSRKGIELLENPFVAMCIHWNTLGRQVIVRGRIKKLPEMESDEYFESRPRGSQIGAWASPQSSIITKSQLEERADFFTKKFEGQSIPRPEHWGGFIIVPDEVEFWQGRPNRLHDRVVYFCTNSGWKKETLAP